MLSSSLYVDLTILAMFQLALGQTVFIGHITQCIHIRITERGFG